MPHPPACLRAQGAPGSLEAVLRRAVLEGSGIGILPTYLVGDDLRQGRVLPALLALEPKTPGIHAIFLSRQHQPLALRLLVDFLAQRFGGPAPPWDRPPVVKRQCKLA